MPADSSAAVVPHVPADVAELLAEVRAALAQVTAPRPLLIDQTDVPTFLGVGRTTWFRWRAEGIAPKPVSAPGAGVKFKRTELEEFVAKLKTA